MNEINVRGLDLNLLYTLHVLLEERHVTKAASRLNLSQSAVSHSLRKLREHFKDPLMVKTRFGMEPTPMAESIMGPLQTILDEINGLISQEKLDPYTTRRTFRLAMSDYGAGIILPRLIERLSERAPNIRIDCVPFSPNLSQDLENGLIDLILGAYKPFELFHNETLFLERFVGVVRKSHPILKGKITKGRMVRWPHTVISLPLRTKRTDAFYEELGVKGREEIYLHEPYFMVAPFIIERSDMILLMPEIGAKIMAEIIDITLFELPIKVEKHPYLQTWHRRRDGDRLHQWLRGQIKEVCKNLQDHYRNRG